MRWTEISETMLYRGDAAKIEQFDVSKTGWLALFGAGIYLTDDPTVAADYTLKGSAQTIVQDAGSPRELIITYLAMLIRDEFAWKTVSEESLDKWRAALNADPDYVKATGRPYDSEATQRITKHYQEQMQQDRMALLAKLLKRAKALFKKRADDMRMVKDTQGLWALMKSQREGYLSSFDIPEDYLARCLHAERPLPDDVLVLLRSLFLNGRPLTTKLDMRDAHGDFMTFDAWVQAYKTYGIDYAWREDDEGRVVKGHGKNPDFDVIRNGTHFGGSWFHDTQNHLKFVAAMAKLGYVGLEYDGGKRVGAHLRGGGGKPHRAFVFWNDADINSFRTASENISHADTELELTIANSIRVSSILYPLGQITG